MLVLVTDDDRAVRESLERALQLAGYEVELASDGDAAIAAIERRTPDAVVLDVMMPGLDGLDVTPPAPARGQPRPGPAPHRPRRSRRPRGRARRRRGRLPAEAVRARGAARPDPRAAAPRARQGAGATCSASPTSRSTRLDGRAPRRAQLRADDDRGAPARAVHAQPAAGAAALAHLRARLGLRLQPLVERARRVRRLPAPQDSKPTASRA